MERKKSFKDPYLKSQHPPWSSYYLDYVHLLKTIKSQERLRINEKKNRSLIRRASSIAVRPLRIDSLPRDSISRIFLDKLDDEIDKVTLFVMRQQGEISNKFLTIKDQLVCNSKDIDLSDVLVGAQELLRLIHFVHANILAVDKLLTVHDRVMAPAGINKMEYLFLSGKIGRERALQSTIPMDRSRLKVLYRHEGLNALVGLAQIVYFQVIIQNDGVKHSVVDRTLSKLQHQNGQYIASMIKEEYDGDSPLTTESMYDEKISRREIFIHLLPMMSESFNSSNRKVNKVITSLPCGILLDSTQETFLQIHKALSNLSKSSQFVKHWAIASGIDRDSEIESDDECKEESSSQNRDRDLSSALNLANSFLYMVSYYMVAPTSGRYAKSLGLSPSMSGAIIGFTAIAALVATILYSWWTSYSYKNAFIFSSLCCIVGNILYALGLPFHSLTLVLAGRFLNGFGSARAINRRFIADAFSKSERTVASAAFVASGAAGMAFGPALSAIMPVITTSDSLWWQEENAPAWIVTGLWILFLALLINYFQDPVVASHNTEITEKATRSSNVTRDMNYNPEEGLPLISDGQGTNEKHKDNNSSDVEIPMWKRPVCLITIFLVFLLKAVLELVLSSAAPITYYYFNWSASRTGWYLAIGNGLVLPAVSLVTYLSRYYQDRQLIIFSQTIMTAGSLMLIHYTPRGHPYSILQFILGTCLLFVGPNTMEGPSMSLLSKNIPRSLRKGLFNLGFFTTEAGFGGRVVADSFLTVCGAVDMSNLVNYLYGSLTILNILVMVLLCSMFDELVDSSGDD